ncbi:MAG TPA: restriction endonuclease [Candidatus Levybacteria bacterium]|nr:restriction endonuclease [Candidatus Levybacteria bacterium]
MVSLKVVKRNGDLEPYSEEKVIHTMNRVGVPPQIQPDVLNHVREQFAGDYITTDEIFKHVFEYLKKIDKKASLRLNLRRAITDLGPTGFPFEKYLARIFQDQGYKTTVDAHLKGECVNHEIDIILEKEGKRDIVEVKFHNDLQGKTDLHVALYTYARYLDLKTKHQIDNVWVITNTKLSQDAVIYAQCKKMKILAWNYPSENHLQHFVESPKMYPVTILTDLTREEKLRLIEDNLVLCRDLLALSEQEVESFPFIKRSHLIRARENARLLLNT